MDPGTGSALHLVPVLVALLYIGLSPLSYSSLAQSHTPLALRILSGLDVLADMQSQNLTASCSISYWRLLTKMPNLEGAQLRLI